MIIFDQLKKGDQQLRLLTLIVLAGILVLFGGLWGVQVLWSQQFKQREQTQSFRTVRIPAIRGKILDRNHRPLAENRPSFNLSLYLEELRPLFGQEFDRLRPMTNAAAGPAWKRWLGLAATASRPVKLSAKERTALNARVRYSVVSNLLAGVGADLGFAPTVAPEKLDRHYRESLVLPVPVMLNLASNQVARMAERLGPLPGLSLEIQPLRHYPHQATACHVLGYVQFDDSPAADEPDDFRYRLPDYRGAVGIEGAFDKELRGRAGMKAVMVNNLGYRQSEFVWLAAEPGMNVVLTLDLTIQQAAERALRSAGNRGAVVVMDANTGDIYAMAALPSFDPGFSVPRIKPEDWHRLNDDAQRPFINRVLQDNYSPGSIFKIVTSLALLENGQNINESWTVEPDPARPGRGMIRVGRQKIEDTALPGEYNFKRAFIKSSNSYFVHYGLKMKNGLEEIVRIAQALHLGEKAGLPTMQEVPGTLPTREWRQARGMLNWSDGQTANICIGQGELDVTPLQMTVMTAAIANGGKVLRPRLVAGIEPQDLLSERPGANFPSSLVRNTLPVSQRTLNIIRDAMRADVEESEGTGKAAAVPGWRVCGKTGTAENDAIRNRGKTTWFASFAPYESPRYVVLVMVEGGASGGGTCAPVAGEIYRALQQWEQRRAQPAVPAATAEVQQPDDPQHPWESPDDV